MPQKVDFGRYLQTVALKSYYGPLGTGHYLAGGRATMFWGEGHNFFSLTLERAIFLKMTLRGGLRIF